MNNKFTGFSAILFATPFLLMAPGLALAAGAKDSKGVVDPKKCGGVSQPACELSAAKYLGKTKRSKPKWWRRQTRSGHAYAETVYRQGRHMDPQSLRPLASILTWGGALPALSLIAAWPTSGLSLALLGTLPVLWTRIYRDRRRCGNAPRDASLYASACILGKLAALPGVLMFGWNRLIRRRDTRLIEYKQVQRSE